MLDFLPAKRKQILFGGAAVVLFYLATAFFLVAYERKQDIYLLNLDWVGQLGSIYLYIAVLCFSLGIFFLIYIKRSDMIVWIYVLLGVIFALVSYQYNIFDETGSVGYARFIFQEGRLPTVSENYEAFQPPLYYLLTGGLTFFIKSEPMAVYAMRILNVFLILPLYYGFKSILKLLKDNEVISLKGFLFDYIPVFFATILGLVYRSSVVTNEILSALFVTITIYYVCLYALGCEKEHTWICLAVVLLCSVMTKITNLILLVPVICVLVYRKKFLKILSVLAVLVLGMLPWLINNIMLYGSLTGAQAHLDFVQPIINPDGIAFSFQDVANRIFVIFSAFFHSGELPITRAMDWMSTFANWVILVLLLYALIRTIVFGIKFIVQKLRFNYDATEKKRVIEMIATSLWFCLLAGLLLLTVRQNITYIQSRYFYSCLVAFMILFALFADKVQVKNKRVMAITHKVVVAGMILYNVLLLGYSMISAIVLCSYYTALV